MQYALALTARLRPTGTLHTEHYLMAFTGAAVCGWALTLAWLWAA